jgi:hypothetical protein
VLRIWSAAHQSLSLSLSLLRARLPLLFDVIFVVMFGCSAHLEPSQLLHIVLALRLLLLPLQLLPCSTPTATASTAAKGLASSAAAATCKPKQAAAAAAAARCSACSAAGNRERLS